MPPDLACHTSPAPRAYGGKARKDMVMARISLDPPNRQVPAERGRERDHHVTDAEVFEEYRGLMFAVAYRMLGTIADAEDAVQDAWLRWSAASRADVANPRAYLARIITNTAVNRLRSVRARREAYIGPWLPEVLLTEAGPNATERAEPAA
jgi:DNA-directed RNA polymerase specialized sigma24 family protein